MAFNLKKSRKGFIQGSSLHKAKKSSPIKQEEAPGKFSDLSTLEKVAPAFGIAGMAASEIYNPKLTKGMNPEDDPTKQSGYSAGQIAGDIGKGVVNPVWGATSAGKHIKQRKLAKAFNIGAESDSVAGMEAYEKL